MMDLTFSARFRKNIQHTHYEDDLFESIDTEVEALKLAKEIKKFISKQILKTAIQSQLPLTKREMLYEEKV